jgi:hypothetical protein
MTLIFRLLFKINNIGTLRTLIKEKGNENLFQTIKRVIAKIMRIYCELNLTLFRYTEYSVSRNGKSSLIS